MKDYVMQYVKSLMFQYKKEEYKIDDKWASPEPYLEKIISYKNIEELLSAPFLL